MKSDVLTRYPIFPQSLHQLSRPCANEEHVCVCRVGTIPCLFTQPGSPVGESRHQSQTSFALFWAQNTWKSKGAWSEL
jgi:hypothetical protein